MEASNMLIWLIIATPVLCDISEIEDFIEQNRYKLKRKYRPFYHISSPVGWLSSPNGFVYFQNQYHIFYQYHPHNSERGTVQWGHVVSDNLLQWVYYPTALIPREAYESNGCLAGSALEYNTYLTLFYTGAETSVYNKTIYTQNLAISGDGIIFQKFLYNPVLKLSSIGMENYRHPRVWKFLDTWYMILGSSSPTNRGQLMLYTSHDMYKWQEMGLLAESFGDMGYLWENPDFFELNGFHILILSVRGIQTEEYRFKNLYQTGYIVGRFNYEAAQFQDTEISTLTFHELDYGHDFYAAQTMLAPDGRRLLVAWLGMYQSDLKETRDGWSSMLTLVREIKMTDQGRLLMTPVREFVALRGDVLEDAWYRPGEAFYAGSKYFELMVNTTSSNLDASLTIEWDDVTHYTVTYSAEHGYVIVDRGGIDGVRRADWVPGSHIYWRIFVDLSSIEVFCGSGEVVFSSRIYPKRPLRVTIGGESHLHITQYKMKRCVGYDKRVRKLLKDRFLKNINNINNNNPV